MRKDHPLQCWEHIKDQDKNSNGCSRNKIVYNKSEELKSDDGIMSVLDKYFQTKILVDEYFEKKRGFDIIEELDKDYVNDSERALEGKRYIKKEIRKLSI